MSLEQTVGRAAWMHNANIMVIDYNPLTLMTSKNVVHPGISTGNVATESMYEDEAVRKAMERHFEIGKKFRDRVQIKDWESSEYKNEMIWRYDNREK